MNEAYQEGGMVGVAVKTVSMGADAAGYEDTSKALEVGLKSQEKLEEAYDKGGLKSLVVETAAIGAEKAGATK